MRAQVGPAGGSGSPPGLRQGDDPVGRPRAARRQDIDPLDSVRLRKVRNTVCGLAKATNSLQTGREVSMRSQCSVRCSYVALAGIQIRTTSLLRSSTCWRLLKLFGRRLNS